MVEKPCFKCGRILPIDDFYRNPGAKDGHSNKCKTCTKSDISLNQRRNKAYYKSYYLARQKTPERKLWQYHHQRKIRQKDPIKYKAWTAVGNAVRDGRLNKGPCRDCGSTIQVEAHHHDYNIPLDVTWLCFSCHRSHEHGQEVGK